jgi:hypothetical protein
MPGADKFFRSPMSDYLFRAENVNNLSFPYQAVILFGYSGKNIVMLVSGYTFITQTK